ncbi:MAG: crossover junction endodeoxyribonuclease RuvC [Deltaproteobacteria bacterium]|nr:crossover junction endodeoxyribonuclease RuvC [Deltaproteobacteria bacterium]
MIILGIDPGSHFTGYGFIQIDKEKLYCLQQGVITPRRSQALTARISEIFKELVTLLAQRKPDAVAIEEIFFAQNARSAIALGEVRGAAIAAILQTGCSFFEYSPKEVKQAVVGYGNASKEQVQQMVKMLLSLNTAPSSDAADALAVAICHAHSMRYRQIVSSSLQRMVEKGAH